jgi:hypothetical protein
MIVILVCDALHVWLGFEDDGRARRPTRPAAPATVMLASASVAPPARAASPTRTKLLPSSFTWSKHSAQRRDDPRFPV